MLDALLRLEIQFVLLIRSGMAKESSYNRLQCGLVEDNK